MPKGQVHQGDAEPKYEHTGFAPQPPRNVPRMWGSGHTHSRVRILEITLEKHTDFAAVTSGISIQNVLNPFG